MSKNEDETSRAREDFSSRPAGMPDMTAELLSQVLDTLPMAITLFTPDLRLWARNRLSIDNLSIPEHVADPGTPLEEIFRYLASRGDYGDEEAVEAFVRERLHAVETNTYGHREFTLANGTVIASDFHRMPDGTVLNHHVDITRQRTQQAEIAARQAELEALVARKDELFALIAHDLRSPLNAVLGFTNLLQTDLEKDVPAEKLRDHLGNLDIAARGLATLVENLLDWARVMMDDDAPAPGAVAVRALAQDAVAPLQALARSRDVAIAILLPDAAIKADRGMITAVLRNLVSNAIRHGGAGGRVTITAVLEPAGKDGGVEGGGEEGGGTALAIAVSDTGPGLSEAQYAALRAGRADALAPAVAGAEGTGLGLRLCRRFLALHDSTLEVESAPGQGATFRFRLPVA